MESSGIHEVFLISEVDKECQLPKIKVKKEKGERKRKKACVFLRVYKFQAYKLFLPEKLLNKFLMQQKKQLVSKNWKGYEENKVCKDPIGRGVQSVSTSWGRAL